jgi:hypothetical protein
MGPRAFAVIVATTLSVLLLAALPAQAGKKYYKGNFPGSPGKLEFVLKRNDGKLRINDFHAEGLIMSCASKPASFTISFKVNRKRRFDVEKHVSGSQGNATAFVKGRLRHGGRASGTLRLVTGSPVGFDCDSGPLEWKASN